MREVVAEANSISEIAAAAGTSRGLLFHYFPTKRDFRSHLRRTGQAA
ncbi:TetR family transcriptional regulator [Nocardia higoensis]|nr:TetR family transcriptional regulator [Nocardia higoensis]